MAGRACFPDGAAGERAWQREQWEVESIQAAARGDAQLAIHLRLKSLDVGIYRDDPREPYGAREI
jgi:hypothetical protein